MRGQAPVDRPELEDLRSQTPHALARVILRYTRDQKGILGLGITSSVLARVFELAPAFLLGFGLDTLFFEARSFVLPGWPTAWTPADPLGQLVLLGGLILGSYALAAGLGWVNGWCWNRVAQTIQHRVRTDAYGAMQERELAFFDHRQTGELMSILNNDVNQLERFLTHGLNMGFRIVVMVGGMAAIMLLLHWQLALIPLISIPILGWVSIRFVDRIYPKYQEVRSSVARLNSRLENNLGGIDVVKTYRQEGFERGRVEDASEGYLKAQWDAITTRIKFFPALRLITAATFTATFLVGGWWVIAGSPGTLAGLAGAGVLTAGTLVTFLLYTRRFMWPMRELGRIVNDHQYAEAASERILGLLEAPPAIRDRAGARQPDAFEGRVRVEDVWFSYDGDQAPVLQGVDLEVQPGETIGLVGATGSGKTTLARLLIRFYEAERGRILIDEHPVTELALASLRDRVSYVRQEPYLFYGTVAENLLYGEPGATDEELVEAARTAGAHRFIEDLPQGYDTMVGERGVKLSGGQRQRIALARAILSDPDILILDEATSHVDNETEQIIQQRLGPITEDRTTFIIAHRLTTVVDADRIVVLDQGQVKEVGSHQDLVLRGGIYAGLWEAQRDGDDPGPTTYPVGRSEEAP